MARTTPYFRLAFFDFADKLDTAINSAREVDRFLLIDKQIYGLYQIFGDGNINGWNIFDNGYTQDKGISIGITNGTGIIKSMAVETNFPYFINGISPSSSVDVFVTITGETVIDRSVNFVYKISGVIPNSSALKIATVVTSSNGIYSIDNSVRDYITFRQIIMDEIEAHKHRGTPSKIDLNREVKNQLPGNRIDNLETSKITQGILAEDAIPTLDHNDLENRGLLSHAALDTFVQGLSEPNLGLLGELAAINTLRQIVFLKYKYSDADQTLINQFAILPGVSSNEQIDFSTSTADIDLFNGCIVGFPFADTDAYFYTNNFVLPAKITRGIITSQYSKPNDSEILFGISTTNSTDFENYQVVEEDRAFSILDPGKNLRLGIKLISGYGHHDPYLINFDDYIDFIFENETSLTVPFQFRIRFYNDIFYSDLYLTKYSGEDQENWVIDDVDSIPVGGYSVAPDESITVTYYPESSWFIPGKVYYVIIDAFDGSSFVSESFGYTFSSSGDSNCDQYANLPVVKNVSILFELENYSTVLLNI